MSAAKRGPLWAGQQPRDGLPTSCDAGGGSCGSGSDTEEDPRCPHTRSRWPLVALLMVAWLGTVVALQRHDIHPLDAAVEHFRHSHSGADCELYFTQARNICCDMMLRPAVQPGVSKGSSSRVAAIIRTMLWLAPHTSDR